jgi:cellulose synthase/poly-beta-1,6-N-acetylglucosamine synthase-like glycosyltransferase
MPEISVFIPVYKDSIFLSQTLTVLTDQNVNKEIVVIVDEPSDDSLDIAEQFNGRVRFVINRERVGKVDALNSAVELDSSNSPILLFLDADTELPQDGTFLQHVIEKMKETDLLDIRKEVVRESFLSKLTYYEYVGFNVCTYLLAKSGGSPAVNGAAFAIKRSVFNSLSGFRNVVSEDLDIATRAYLDDYRFGYMNDVTVYNHVKSTWKDWIIQRRRWTIGAALWVGEWHKQLLKKASKHPKLYIFAIFLLFPSSVVLISNVFFPHLLIYDTLALVFLLLPLKFSILLPVLLLTHVSLNMIENLAVSLLTFFVFAVAMVTFSRKLGFAFRIHEFLLFYYFYSLLCTGLMITGFVRVFVLRRYEVRDWKVGSDVSLINNPTRRVSKIGDCETQSDLCSFQAVVI